MAKLYISGPVTGVEHDNWNEFVLAKAKLRAAGHKAEMPHDFVAPGTPHDQAMLICISALTDQWESFQEERRPYRRFDGVALLPGWEQSEGARLEKAVAEACGITVKTIDEWLEEAR